ncbi:hypothetical protein PT285_06610 [Lactobacillus sp. ESL0791]|uniref:hypothetical protein n=1 Tax=Lactobacillus sp. ESL0791 TaxID=2983234 RepID=UPI0023F8DD77|nr:hypothetical protein [Lactobacillus sp. ESL0791]MDF7639071.1 hypothetical protein [Lactobacillus sp. ESL0791]
MQFYLANRLGIDTAETETAIKQQKLPMMSETKKFRDDYLPYAKIEGKMKEIN